MAAENYTRDDLNKKTKPELVDIIKQRQIPIAYSRLKKNELIDAILTPPAAKVKQVRAPNAYNERRKAEEPTFFQKLAAEAKKPDAWDFSKGQPILFILQCAADDGVDVMTDGKPDPAKIIQFVMSYFKADDDAFKLVAAVVSQ